MDDFSNKIAVITGAGDGMGRSLAKQLAAAGCHIAVCDLFPEPLAETKKACEADAPAGTRITTHLCDVSDEPQVIAFKDEVVAAHETDHVDLLFNNAGIGGAGSMLTDDRDAWERHVQRLLERRLPEHESLPPAADGIQRKPPHQHQQRERILGVDRAPTFPTPPTAQQSSRSRGSQRP